MMTEPRHVNKVIAEFMWEMVCDYWGYHHHNRRYQCEADPEEKGERLKCVYCDHGLPAYDESLDLMRGVEAKIRKDSDLQMDYHDEISMLGDGLDIICAPPDQRARVAVRVIEEAK